MSDIHFAEAIARQQSVSNARLARTYASRRLPAAPAPRRTTRSPRHLPRAWFAWA